MINFFSRISAKAHCDIPCGIYEPVLVKIYAKTILRMVQQLKVLNLPRDSGDKDSVLQYTNSIARRIRVKEDHADLCKKELEVLWSDFFKPEHLEKFPDLHEIFWQAVKLCSKNKQEVNEESAEKLIKKVDMIAKVFYEIKKVPERFGSYKEITDNLY